MDAIALPTVHFTKESESKFVRLLGWVVAILLIPWVLMVAPIAFTGWIALDIWKHI